MSTPADTVRAVFDAISREDVKGFLALTHEDIELIEPESLPVGGVHRGHDAVTKNVLMVMGRRFRVRVLDAEIIGEGPTVAASVQVEFTSRTNGETMTMPYVELHTVRDGKVARLAVYPQDTHGLLAFWNED